MSGMPLSATATGLVDHVLPVEEMPAKLLEYRDYLSSASDRKDGDGDVDCATCAFGDSTCAWFENDGKGNFKTHIVGTDRKAYDIRAIDMDNDGDLDLLVAGQNSKNVVWYANPRR